MSKKVYPEIRHSHLAAELERQRALKILKKNRKKNEAANMTSPLPQSSPRKRRKPALGRPIPHPDREALLSFLAKRDREILLDEMVRLGVPSRNANTCTLRLVEIEPEHTYSSTKLLLLARLAEFCRNGGRRSNVVPMPGTQPVPAQNNRAPLPMTALAPRPQSPMPQQDMVMAISQAVATAVATVMGPMLQQQSPPQLPAPMPEQTEPTGIKQFADMPPAMQRRILHSMHTRYGQFLRANGVTDGEYATAWNMSYDEYHRVTGIDIKGQSSAENDETGHRVSPIELIERSGDLVRFWQIVRSLWERQ